MPAKKKRSLGVSVIIPAYNAEKNIQACVDALLAQTRLPDEIIVVDDGSIDQTKTIAGSYSLVQVISQSNQGPAKARNAGARAAKNDLIVFLDSDCVPERTWLEEMLAPFSDSNVAGVQGAYKTRQTSLVARFDQLDIEYRYARMKRAEKLDWIGSYSAAYRREIFVKEGGFDETFPKASGEDAEFSYRLAEKGYILMFAPTAFVYHTHPATLLKYLQIKFFRAYWRTRMYLKYPRKMMKDSYTPNELKLNVVLGGAFFASAVWYVLAVLFFSPSLRFDLLLLLLPLFFWIVIVGFTFSTFLLEVFHKDVGVFAFSFLLIPLRSIVFFTGLATGILDRRVRA